MKRVYFFTLALLIAFSTHSVGEAFSWRNTLKLGGIFLSAAAITYTAYNWFRRSQQRRLDNALEDAANGKFKKIKNLLKRGVKVPDLALNFAARHGKTKIAKRLLDNGANPNSPNTMNITPLMEAASKGHGEIVELLLTRNANIDTVDMDGWTALIWAIQLQKKEMVTLLIQCGANREHRDNHQRTPIMHAATIGNQEIIAILENGEVDNQAVDEFGNTAADWAQKVGYSKHSGLESLLE